jgi:thiamine kinase-like enzyme
MDNVFSEQLDRFYRAAQLNCANLTEYYQFSPTWGDSVKHRIEELLGGCPDEEQLTIDGRKTYNIHHFYSYKLIGLSPFIGDFPFSYIHGDLNGANIIVDARDNVWLIDFFHTHHGHALKDFAKLENDILFIYTPVNDQNEFEQACALTDILVRADCQKPLPTMFDGLPQFSRTYETLRHLRQHMLNTISDWGTKPDLQWALAQLRYAVHTAGFDEPNLWQRQWALYAAGQLAERWLCAHS